MKRVGNELEKSKNVLRDTPLEPQPIIEAFTACTSQHKPRRDIELLIRSQCQERDCATHISERHRNALPRKNHCLQNRALKTRANACCVLVQHCSRSDKIQKYKCGHQSADKTLCTSVSVIVTETYCWTPVKKFGSCSCDDVKCALNRRKQVDEVRRTPPEFQTSSTS